MHPILPASNPLHKAHRTARRGSGRLRRMIAVHINPLLNARVDPSDVVQEVFAEASRRLPAYARRESLPFFPWLRQIAWDRLVALDRRHIRAQKRSVRREEVPGPTLPDESALGLADPMAARVRAALDQLDPQDREVLVMRYLEQLKVSEIAALLGRQERSGPRKENEDFNTETRSRRADRLGVRRLVAAFAKAYSGGAGGMPRAERWAWGVGEGRSHSLCCAQGRAACPEEKARSP